MEDLTPARAVSSRVLTIAALAAGLGALAAGAMQPLLSPAIAKLQTRMTLPIAARAASPSASPPLLDPASSLRLLEVDPVLRASAALYDAALMRPQVARGVFDPRRIDQAAPSAAILIALIQTEAILSGPALLPPRSPRVEAVLRRSVGAPDRNIRSAAELAGVDAHYLLKTAVRESANNPYAMARGTSARGLFQFIDQTWLLAVAKWGARHGLALEAASIRIGDDGRAFVPDAARRREILLLRYDPLLSARMAAEFAAENDAHLTRALRRRPSSGELYAAHLLGARGATVLIQTAYRRPDYPAAALLPAAAAKNKRLFYRNGFPRSASELLLSLS